MSLSIILLAYEEAENLKLMLPKLNEIASKMIDEYEILVIDSAVPLDNTSEVCKLNNATYIPQEEPKYGGAFRTGINYASKEIILVLDADFSHNPEDIPRLYKKFQQGYDLVIGSRYTKGGISNDSKTSYIMSKLLNTVMRIVVGVKAKDISTSFRIYNAKLLKSITLTRVNYEILQEVIFEMKQKKSSLTIAEVPITFNKRLHGETKRDLFNFIKCYMIEIVILIKMRLKRKK